MENVLELLKQQAANIQQNEKIKGEWKNVIL